MKVRNGKVLRAGSFMFFLFLISLNASVLREDTIDYVIATVNGEAIAHSALENESFLNYLFWKTDLEVQRVGPDGMVVLSGGDDYGLVAKSVMEVLDRETRQRIAHIQIKQVDSKQSTAVISGS